MDDLDRTEASYGWARWYNNVSLQYLLLDISNAATNKNCVQGYEFWSIL